MLPKRSKYEVLIVLIVTILAVVISIGIYAGRNRLVKEKVMRSELLGMRTAIALYKTLNGSNPRNLGILTIETFSFNEGIKSFYLESLPIQDNGKILDPFGNEYSYNSELGWVTSSTKEYDSW